MTDDETPAEAAAWAGSAASAHEVAAHLDYCVDHLVAGVVHQPSPHAYTMYVDLLMGLAMTAEALRARSRGDLRAADRHNVTASACLSRVVLDEIVLEDDLDDEDWD